jgi:hypothetical protein
LRSRSINNHLEKTKVRLVDAEKCNLKKKIPTNSENLKNELFGNQERPMNSDSYFQRPQQNQRAR